MKMRRINVAPEILLAFTRGKYEVISNPVPLDAKVVGYGFDRIGNCFYLEVESAEFTPDQPFQMPSLVIKRLDA